MIVGMETISHTFSNIFVLFSFQNTGPPGGGPGGPPVSGGGPGGRPGTPNYGNFNSFPQGGGGGNGGNMPPTSYTGPPMRHFEDNIAQSDMVPVEKQFNPSHHVSSTFILFSFLPVRSKLMESRIFKGDIPISADSTHSQNVLNVREQKPAKCRNI